MKILTTSHNNDRSLIFSIIGILFLLPLTTVVGQPSFNSYLLPNSVEARSGALAYSNIADSWSSASMYVNPAAPLFAHNKSTIESSLYYNFNKEALSRALIPLTVTDTQNLIAGLSYRRPITSRQSTSQTPIQRNDYFRLDLGYSFQLSNTLGFGILGGFSGNQTMSSRSFNFTPAAGLYYSPTPSLNYGIVYKGSFKEIEQPISGTDSTETFNPHHVEIGLSLKYPTGIKDPYLRVSLSNLKIIGKDGLWYKGGFEVWPYEIAALRIGYASGPSADRFSSGLGLKLGNAMLDYSIGFFQRSDNQEFIHQIGISINIR